MKKALIILAIIIVGILLSGQSVVDTTKQQKPLTKEQKYEALRKDLKEQKIEMKKINNDTIN